MLGRTVGIDLAIRGEHVAQVFEDGRPLGKPIRFRLTAKSLQRFVDTITAGLPEGTPVRAVMEPTGMAWFPVAVWLSRAGVTVIRIKGQRVRALRRYLSEHVNPPMPTFSPPYPVTVVPVLSRCSCRSLTSTRCSG